MVKLGQMEMSTFEALRDEIVGGDVKNVHLVKGLDWKLLERVRRGEDVLGDSLDSTKSDVGSQTLKEGPEAPTEVEIEEELDRFESKEIQPISKSKNTKKGEMAPPPTVVGRKRNRDEILKELKASRLASAKQSSLGPRFTKVGDRKEKTRMEKDEKGRDVLITVDEDGNVKRKVRKAPNQTNSADNRGLLMPEKDAKPLGMDVVPIAHVAPDLSEEDIFEGVGADYNPLGDPEEDDSGDSTMGDSPRGDRNHTPLSDQAQADNDSNLAPEPNLLANPSSEALDPPPLPAHHPPRNYFNDSTRSTTAVDGTTPSGLQTPILLAALKKASTLIPLSGATSEAEAARLERRRKMLESHDRDADDLDMGFGESRFEDGEDGDEGKVKLSVWGQGGGGGGGGSGEDGNRKGKRKRGGKKRKGDANSAVDVLRVIETRKAAGRQ
jgi:uridine nucleosidase